MKKIGSHEIASLLFQPEGRIKVFFLCTNKTYLSFSIRQESRLFCAGNCEELHALQMKHGFLPILGIYSPGIYLIITHSRNKSICYCRFGTELLFAKNRPKITYFWIRSNPAINKRKAHKPSLYSNIVWLSLHAQRKFHMDLNFPSIKLSGIKFLLRVSETKMGGAITPSFSFSSK